jgi:transposase
MQYTVRAFVEGRDERLDEICRTFSSMERTAYNVLREGVGAGAIKAILRERYSLKNARWCQSATNQARAVTASQEEGIKYRIEQCEEKISNTREKMERLSNTLKIKGCRRKIERYESKAGELKKQLRERSYPRAVFGSKKLFHKMSITDGQRRDTLKKKWIERRSDHFFSVGQANQRGNGNTRLLCEEDNFSLEIRNWPGGDFRVPLHVPGHWSELLKGVISGAESVKLGRNVELLENGGLAYSVRVIRSSTGYQVLISFELDEPPVEWGGRLAGIDVNPEGIACTVASEDGNLVATRFFRDNRLVTASKNRRKWVLEDTVNRMLRWCMDTHGCSAVAVERLRFKGAHDFSPRTNFKLSNFMKRKMLQTIRLHALKMRMLSVEVNPAYTSKVAVAKYGKRYGGFNRHQLAAFVIARRALGYGEAPVLDCLPRTKQDRSMWNRCVSYYGHPSELPTPPRREPMERKSGGDAKGGRTDDELLTAPPAITSSRMGSSHAPYDERELMRSKHQVGERGGPIQTATQAGEMGREGTELALRTHSSCVRRRLSSLDKEDSVIC